MAFASIKVLLVLLFVHVVFAEDFYELLGVSKDADNRDIRRAFKKLALKMHPDKNIDDKDAHDKFVKINKAYEVLKDEETRKKYDLYGEEGLKDDFGQSWKGNYHSWNFYYESFGIYDDDPEIITLSKSEFEQSVLDSPDTWFINFYSPQCSHCHHLAPVWRKMARELENVINIGAVNCEEDWMLCRQQNIQSYPSLIVYPERENYRGSRETDDMIDFILKRLPNKIISLSSKNAEDLISRQEYKSRPWLVCSCKDKYDCIFDDVLQKLSVILDGLVNIARAYTDHDGKLCKIIGCDHKLTYYKNLSIPIEKSEARVIDESDTKEILDEVLKLLPATEDLTDKKFLEIQEELESSGATAHPWLIEFTKHARDSTVVKDAERKRLQSILPGVHFGHVDCNKYSSVCSPWSFKKSPMFILFKSGGAYEFHHGRFTAQNIATFVRQSLSSKVETLSPKDFPDVVSSDEPWFIDFFAPWCPPCMQLLPEWRKASRTVGHLVKFGTVDCTMHTHLCNQYNIQSYPTTILFNQTVPHRFHGSHNQQQLEEFVMDTLNPPVISLTPESFEYSVNEKKKEDMWVIDFFAPWCRPCQQLSQQWRKLAKMLKHDQSIHVAQVDCTVHRELCVDNGINSYPTIRLYPKGKKGAKKFHFYNDWNRDAKSIQAWVYSFLPSKVEVLGSADFEDILEDTRPWVIDFYAPWCGHCQIFAPEFEKVARVLEGKVHAGKVNCEQLPQVCQKAAVRAYPTVLFYSGKKGKSVQDPMGEEIHSQQQESVISFIENKLGMKLKDQKHDEL